MVDATASSITGTVTVSDTPTIDLELTGSGSVADPYDISGQATVSVADLEDVATGAPASGDTLLWNGEEWVYGPPSSGGGGAVVVTGEGINGDGSTASPVELATSGTWGSAPLNRYGTNTLLGAPIYIDANGQARSQPLGIQIVGTGEGRPDQYPGRVIVQGGVPYYSTGSQWVPLGPTVEGPYQVMQNNWSQAGITLASGVTVSSDASYMLFSRAGSTIFAYCSGIRFTPSGGGTSGNITNKDLMQFPSEMAPVWITSLLSGPTGRMAAFSIGPAGNVAISATTAPSSSWSEQTFSYNGLWQLDPTLDPETALAAVASQATPIQAPLDSGGD